MPLRIFISNHPEKLAEILATGLLNTPAAYRAADPFRKTRIIVQSKGMEIWLKQSLVKQDVPVINFEFPFVVKGIKDILAANFGGHDVDVVFRRYSESAMTWTLEAILRDDDSFLSLLPPAEEKTVDIQRFEFAASAAAEFDRLQTYRHEILEAWESGHDINCGEALKMLPELWRRLKAANRDCPTTRAGLIKKFLQLPVPAATDPFSVFGIGAMPQEYFKVFAKQAENNTVNFFYSNICREYWSFHPLAKEKLTAEAGELSVAEGEYNPLIKACGHRNREFFQTVEKIMDGNNVQWNEEWVEEEASSLLKEIQNEVLNMSSPESPVPFAPAADLSLTVHGAHSKMRQVEIVHDLILDAVNNGNMQMNDILVMAPDISSFAREIQAVFSDGPLRGNFAIADRNADENNTLVGCLKALVETVRGRFELPALSRLLQRKILLDNFNLSEQSVYWLEKLFYTAGVRWGVDGEMRREECGVGFDEYSWQAGLDRILAGIALDEDDDFAPVTGCDDSEKQKDLMAFLRFFRLLTSFREELKEHKTPEVWGGVMLRALNDFAGKYADITEKSILQKAVSSIVADAVAGGCRKNSYPFIVFYSALQKALAIPPPYSSFLSGKITFSSMQPMRNIPRRMIVLMGMDDGKFPRRDEVRNIDVFGHRMPGERSKIFEDRAIFLETILAAREQLVFVYGMRPQSGRGEDLPPATPLKELLEYIKNTRENGDKIVVRHPAYGFSAMNFSGVDPRIFSYSGKYLEMAQAVPEAVPDFCAGYRINSLDSRPAENFTIADICKFLHAPQEYFLKNNLDMNVYEYRDITGDREEFDENKFILAKYREELGKAVNAGADIDGLWRKYSRMALFPVGISGRLVFDKMVNDCRIKNSFISAMWMAQEKIATDITLPSGDRISGIIEASPDLKSIVKCCFKRIKKRDIIDLYVNNLILATQSGNENFSPTAVLDESSQKRDIIDCIDFYVNNLLLATQSGNENFSPTAVLVDVLEQKYYIMAPVSPEIAMAILKNITALMKESRYKCPSLLGVSSVVRKLDDKFDDKSFIGSAFGFNEFDRENFAVRKCFPESWTPVYDNEFAAESELIYCKLSMMEANS